MEGKRFLYSKLYDSLKGEILSGNLKPGERLPAEAELQEQFHVSAITVKKALGLLVEEGLVQRVPGRGSFVSEEFPPEEAGRKAPAPPSRTANIIGVVLEHVATPFGLEMMYAMDEAARELGFRLCIRFSYSDRKREAEEIRFLLSLGVAGLVIMPAHGPHYSTEILRLVVNGFPVILVDKNLEGIPVPSVRTDNEDATAVLVRHLAERGRRRIAFVSADGAGTTSLLERRRGFYHELDACGLPTREECVLSPYPRIGGNDHTQSKDFFREYFERMRGEVDGVVCAEFGLVPSVLAGLHGAGLQIPDDIAVCCIDEDYDAPLGYFCTHARQDESEIARRAVALMADWIAGKRPPAMDYRIPALFRQGQST